MMQDIEIHPFPPFLPENARVLIMGTFPPQPKRWSMEFYYPNRTNDFWAIMGLIFLGDKTSLLDKSGKSYNLAAIKALLNEKGIALSDTGYRVKRLKGNASDKFLEIIEPVNLQGLLSRIPQCRTVATTGEKAAGILAEQTDTQAPKIGEFVTSESGLHIWRMPSTSRAYPLSIEKKAIPYRNLFSSLSLV